MKRREFIVAASLLAASCAAPMSMAGAAAFTSDRITVTTVGSGPDVVLIPGMGSTPEIWSETVAAVPGYRYHLVQVSGFAGTPVRGNGGTGPVVADIAAEIARYIREAGLSKPAVIGHSMGGTLGMTIAATNPNAISKLMVVDMLPYLGMLFAPPGSSPDAVRAIAEQTARQIAATTPGGRRASVEATIAQMVRDESKRARQVQHSLASDLNLNARVMRDLISTDLRPGLAAFTGPLRVLYVRGPNIPLTDAQMDTVYQVQFSGNPQARLERVPDAYHFIMLDQPARFQTELRAFLN